MSGKKPRMLADFLCSWVMAERLIRNLDLNTSRTEYFFFYTVGGLQMEKWIKTIRKGLRWSTMGITTRTLIFFYYYCRWLERLRTTTSDQDPGRLEVQLITIPRWVGYHFRQNQFDYFKIMTENFILDVRATRLFIVLYYHYPFHSGSWDTSGWCFTVLFLPESRYCY